MLLPGSYVGDIHFTSDATETGDWTKVIWRNWSRLKKVKTPVYGSEGTPFLSVVGTGAQGSVVLIAETMYSALYQALRVYANHRLHHVFHAVHTELGEVDLDVEVQSVISSTQTDDQLDPGDPVDNVLITMMSFGVAA